MCKMGQNQISTIFSQARNQKSCRVYSCQICLFTRQDLFWEGLRHFWLVIENIFMVTILEPISFKNTQLVFWIKKIYQISWSAQINRAKCFLSIPPKAGNPTFFHRNQKNYFSASRWTEAVRLLLFHPTIDFCTQLVTKAIFISGIWKWEGAWPKLQTKVVSIPRAFQQAQMVNIWAQVTKWVLSTSSAPVILNLGL